MKRKAVFEHFLISVISINSLIYNSLYSGMLCSIFQRYKLKAIHNSERGEAVISDVVLNISKIQTESNSQLIVQDLPI